LFHLHGFQRHDGLARRNALALLDQNRNDTTVHCCATLAIAAARGRRCCRRKGEIVDRKRDPTMQDVEPIAVAQISRRFHAAVAAETYAIGFKLIDLEAALATIETCDITAVALARDLEIIGPMIELNADRKRKCRGERAAFAPRRRMRVG